MCLQETKLSNLSNNHLKILAHYHLSYILYPAECQSGGLLTIFPENFTLLETHKSSNTISIHFSQLNFTLTNIYIKPTDYHLQHFLSDIFAIEQFHCELISYVVTSMRYHQLTALPAVMSQIMISVFLDITVFLTFSIIFILYVLNLNRL